MASLIDRDPASGQVQEAIASHYKHLRNFYTPTPEMYRALGGLYASDARFRAHYDKYATNLADFLKKPSMFSALKHRKHFVLCDS